MIVDSFKIKYVGNHVLKDYRGMNAYAARKMGFAYPYGKDTILIDQKLTGKVRRETIKHEIEEVKKMRSGASYWTAHKYALKKEREVD